MFTVEMTDKVEVSEGTSTKTGKPYKMSHQHGYIKLPHLKYPLPFKVTLGSKNAPFVAGVYVLGPESIVVDRFGSLTIVPKLTRAPVATQAKVA